MCRVIIEIDERVGVPDGDGDGDGDGDELRCVGFVGRRGVRVRSSVEAEPMDLHDAHALIVDLKSYCPNLIFRVVPAPGVLAGRNGAVALAR